MKLLFSSRILTLAALRIQYINWHRFRYIQCNIQKHDVTHSYFEKIVLILHTLYLLVKNSLSTLECSSLYRCCSFQVKCALRSLLSFVHCSNAHFEWNTEHSAHPHRRILDSLNVIRFFLVSIHDCNSNQPTNFYCSHRRVHIFKCWARFVGS